MVAFACGVTAALFDAGIRPDYVAGLSLGEYSALEASGVFAAKAAIELAAYRGAAMASASEGVSSAMTAVLMLDRESLARCCEEAGGMVRICNYNCPGQIVIGGEAGSFLGEYQAGGYIIVLGLHSAAQAPVGSFCSAGMHGGKLYIRTDAPLPADLPEQVTARDATPGDLAEIRPYLERFCAVFAIPLSALLSSHFYVITPNTATPYKRLYVTN